MKSKKYHANLPYPVIKDLKPNKKQAMMLMQGYSGRISELSTVAQYSYHYLKCSKNNELSNALKGIFLVETHHMQLLGDCINQLGHDPRYIVYSKQANIPWQANVINYENNIEQMILADINGEKEAVNYYIETAKKIDNCNIVPLLLRLAEDEKLHVRIFTDLYNKYFGKK